ncbi:XkdF-like putative serine protease domain-containing protein [Terribacillus sp. 7520-G]|uniref:XkdF-like putative serine protease domain-containing protein n=1 Tax=Terribacillus TaxID=459532 RepID=UPI000BA6BCBB|nr:XkdF-like putative serine protease domain-containing protein [Terribacillus sp. 7520-G]PAD38616.1 terminase [Terribacillus sp. 7520-G]
MARELKNASITHVSYVDKGANQKTFFFTKSDDKPDFQKHVQVFVNKDEEEQQLVYGVVYEPDVEDSHGDFMTAPEIEKAAHGFMKDARNIDTQHDFQAGVGEVVESYIAPCDMEIGGHDIAKGSWVLVTKATDEIWQSIKKGEYTGYSMAGKAEIIEKRAADPVSAPDESEMAGFFNMIKSFFSSKEKVQKGEVRDNYEANQSRRNLWAAWDGLDAAYHNALWDNRTPEVTDFERLKEAAQEFLEIIAEIQTAGDIQKAMESKPEKPLSKEEDTDVKKEDLEKMFDDKFAPIQKRLDDLEKEENPVASSEGTGKEEDLAKQFGEILDEKLAPLTDRIEKVEQARGITQQSDDDPNDTDVQKSASVWDGLL